MYLWKKENVPYYNEEYHDGFIPSMQPYITKDAKTCIIVCPGGGYISKAAEHEGRQIANWLNSIGVSAFVLDYRVAPYKHPVPVTDAKRAIRYARYLADEYGYAKDQIGIMGFSAGGHLAGSAGTFKGDFGYEPQDEIDQECSKPDFMVLCYPVISCCEYAHRGSFENLSAEVSAKCALELSIDKNVDSATPPTFLFHTAADQAVPVENSLLMASALSRYDVPFDMHIFNHGVHGIGLANGDSPTPLVPHSDMWPENLKNWLQSMKYLD